MSNLEILNITKKYAEEVLGLESGEKFVLNSGFQDEEIGYTNALMVEMI